MSLAGVFEFTDLDFSGSEELVGFAFINNFLGLTVSSITPTSIAFDQAVDSPFLADGGTWFSGTFITRAPSAGVPAPASLGLLALGLLLVRRRFSS